MRNITVNISDDTYREARAWAARRDTSVSAVMQYLLQTLPAPRVPRTVSEACKPLAGKDLPPLAS
jgi:hypothetical protein